MATHDLTVAPYQQANGYSGIGTVQGWNYRRFTGADLKTLKDGTAPANGDNFKIAKLGKGMQIRKVSTTVLDADDTALTLDIGYTDGTNGADNTFEDDAALNATGTTESADDIITFPNVATYTLDPFLTIKPSAISTLDDATEFVVGWFTVLIPEVISTQLTAPV